MNTFKKQDTKVYVKIREEVSKGLDSDFDQMAIIRTHHDKEVDLGCKEVLRKSETKKWRKTEDGNLPNENPKTLH